MHSFLKIARFSGLFVLILNIANNDGGALNYKTENGYLYVRPERAENLKNVAEEQKRNVWEQKAREIGEFVLNYGGDYKTVTEWLEGNFLNISFIQKHNDYMEIFDDSIYNFFRNIDENEETTQNEEIKQKYSSLKNYPRYDFSKLIYPYLPERLKWEMFFRWLVESSEWQSDDRSQKLASLLNETKRLLANGGMTLDNILYFVLFHKKLSKMMTVENGVDIEITFDESFFSDIGKEIHVLYQTRKLYEQIIAIEAGISDTKIGRDFTRRRFCGKCYLKVLRLLDPGEKDPSKSGLKFRSDWSFVSAEIPGQDKSEYESWTSITLPDSYGDPAKEN